MKSRYWFVSILLMLVACSYLFYYFYELERTRTIEEIVSHQKIHANQAARSFDELFVKWNGVLSYLSYDRNIILMNASGRYELYKLMRMLKDEIKGITRTDKTGRIEYTVPYYPNSIGADISKQKHMTKILADHKPIVSDVFHAVQGFQAIAIHHPVFRDGNFDGTIAFVLNFGQIVKGILDEIRIGNSGHAWMLSSEGVELYSPVPGHIGKSIRETGQGFPDLLRLADTMLSGKEGIATYTYSELPNESRRAEMIAYYRPVKINNTFWSLAVVYSEDEITASIADVRNKLAIIFALILLGGICFSYFGIKGWITLRETEGRNIAERELLESEKRFRSVYENSSVGIYRMTPEGKILLANPTLISTLGYSTFEEIAATGLMGEGFEDSFDRAHFIEKIKQGVEVKDLVSCWIKRDGTRVFIRENARPIRDSQGKTLYYDGIVEDITERIRAEEKLKENEESYRLLFEENPAPMLIYQRGTMKILAVNKAFERHYGYTSEEALMMRLTDLYPAEEQEVITELVADLHGYGTVGEWHHRKRDGSFITIVACSNDLLYEGHNARVAVITDITDRKIAEENLKTLNIELEKRVAERTAKLEASYDDLESFSYSVSHDLRAPLRAISGFAEIISRRHRTHLNPEGQHYIDNIVQASGHMGHLIDDLLTYSRLGRRSVGHTLVSLQEVLDGIGKNFAQHVKETGATLEIPADVPSVIGDRSLLDQIFTNLIQNALLYHKPDVPAQVTIAWQTQENAIILTVSDNGIGISEECHGKIFDIFQRLHSDDEYPGTGIGLATVKRGAELLGGKVWLESKVGIGSTFFVRVPKE